MSRPRARLVAVLVVLFAGAPARAATTVEASDNRFTPARTSVRSGDTVTWRNTGRAPHNATAADRAFSSGTIEPGGTFTWTATRAGTHEYTCTFHPGMSGTLVVTAARPTTALPDTGGDAVRLGLVLLAVTGAVGLVLRRPRRS